MRCGRLLRHTWQVIWDDKRLFLLGLLIAAGAGSGAIGGFELSLFGAWVGLTDLFTPASHPPASAGQAAPPLPEMLPPGGVDAQALLLVVAGTGLALICLLGSGVIALGVLSVMARGGLIAIAGTREGSDLREALRVGWRNLWRLLITLSFPFVPVTVGAIIAIVLLTVLLKQAGVTTLEGMTGYLADSSFAGLVAAIMVPLFALSLMLGFLQVFADRACVLEDKRPVEAYRRGWLVLRANLLPALALLAFDLGLRLALGLLLSTLTFTIILRFVLPLPLLLGTALRTYLTTLWTLAWREWTGEVGLQSLPARSDPA